MEVEVDYDSKVEVSGKIKADWNVASSRLEHARQVKDDNKAI